MQVFLRNYIYRLQFSIFLFYFILMVFIWAFPLILIDLFKNLFRYAREAYQTGNILRMILKSVLQLIVSSLLFLICVNLLTYVIFLYEFVIAGISEFLGATALLLMSIDNMTVYAFQRRALVACLRAFELAIDIDRPSFAEDLYNKLFVGEVFVEDPLQRDAIPRDAPQRDEFRRQQRQSIDSLPLSDAELAILRADHVEQLTANEIAQLEGYQNQVIKAQLEEYKNLHQRLEVDQCPITTERPSRDDTLLVVKLYQDGVKWVPVPNSSYIFYKDALNQHFEKNAINVRHPIMGESITLPEPYTKADQHNSCITRYTAQYRIYPYYPSTDATSGTSQELSNMAKRLKAHLVMTNEEVRAKRFRFFKGIIGVNAPCVQSTSDLTEPRPLGSGTF